MSLEIQTKIRRVALNLLARRDHSQQELTLKLKSKGYPGKEIGIVILELFQAGLINEERFTENYIYWRRAKGFGPLRLSLELRMRGITDEMIAEHLKITDNVWFTEARKVRQKHFKGQQVNDIKNRAKQMRFLQSRGFTREQIESALDP